MSKDGTGEFRDLEPVVRVGVLASILGSVAAGAMVATTIGAFAVIALVVGARHARASGRQNVPDTVVR